MNIHELLKVFLNESNNKELMLHACMLTGNREDALDLLSDLLIEIYENPMVLDALDPMAYFKAILRNKAYNLRRRNKRMIPVSPDELPETTQKLCVLSNWNKQLKDLTNILCLTILLSLLNRD